MRRIMVSGTFDLLHGGHVRFLEDARALGDHLTVVVPSDRVLTAWKGRLPATPLDHRLAVIKALRCVDGVEVGDEDPPLNFTGILLGYRPDVLAVSDDDIHADEKRRLAERIGAEFVILAKGLAFAPVSARSIRERCRIPGRVPLRVDFAGGWLDVPRLARPGGRIVNCAIEPRVGLGAWPYRIGAGLGGSAAWRILKGEDGLAGELDAGAGWQDPAVILETGLCVWRSGPRPVLEVKYQVDWLRGRLALLWLGGAHDTPSLVDRPRDYDTITLAGRKASAAAARGSVDDLGAAMLLSYDAQIREGMDPLPSGGPALGFKYAGAGWGGYGMYLFGSEQGRAEFLGRPDTMAVEPYLEDRSCW